MSSLRNHPSFQYLIQKCFPDQFGTFTFIKKVYIGHFTNYLGWNLQMEVEECGYEEEDDSMIFIFRCLRDNSSSNIIYEQKWTVPYDYEYIMKYVDIELTKFMKKLHEVNECQHCGTFIFSESSFDDKCFQCGIQNIYDSTNSESQCSICLQSIGYGYIKQCKNKHYMHSYCFIKYNLETNKELCPLRCGSIIE